MPVDQFNAATGRLVVNPRSGDHARQAYVMTDIDHATAGAGFTSLSGVSYTLPF
jgi:hypothetical protein